MGGMPPGAGGAPGGQKQQQPKKKFEAKPLTRVGKKKRKHKGPAMASKLPKVQRCDKCLFMWVL